MKKLLLSFVALFGVMSFASAVDKITVEDVQVRQGKTGEISIKLEAEHNLRGTQFDLILPAGVSIIADGDGILDVSLGSAQHRLYIKGANQIAKYTDVNRYRLVTYIQEETSEGVPVLATGELFHIGIELTGDFSVDQRLTATITGSDDPQSSDKINFSDADDASVSYIQEDLTFNIIVVEDRVIFDENAEKLPIYAAGKENIRMNRTIQAGVWSTVCFPFSITKAQADEIFGSGHKLAAFTGWDVEFPDASSAAPSAVTVNFTTVTAGRTYIVGGTPYLLKSENAVETFDLNQVTLVTAPKPVAKELDIEGLTFNGSFVGSFVATTIPEDGMFISDNKFWYSTGSTNTKGFRSWLELDGVYGKDMDFGVKMQIDGIVTNINDLDIEKSVEGVYTIDGKKMNNDVTRLPKGVYLINGKKVAVK